LTGRKKGKFYFDVNGGAKRKKGEKRFLSSSIGRPGAKRGNGGEMSSTMIFRGEIMYLLRSQQCSQEGDVEDRTEGVSRRGRKKEANYRGGYNGLFLHMGTKGT